HIWTLSALEGEGLDDLLVAIAAALEGERREEDVHLSFAEGRQRAWLFDRDLVLKEHQTEDGFDLRVKWNAKDRARFGAL
ncbi:MAG: GTPase HflX, partial [Pseudomonadota bacterium]